MDGIINYAINSPLYLRTLRKQYIHMYEAFISQLHIHEKAIRILLKGYLPISLLPQSKLQEILGAVKKGYSKDKSRLWYSHKKTTSILWYGISYFLELTEIEIW